MDDLHFRISAIANNSEFTDAAKIEQIKALLLKAEAVGPTTGIIERLVVSLKTAGFTYTNPYLTSANCPTVAEPSFEGARLKEKLVGSRTSVLAKLKSDGRRSATVAEGLLYGLTHIEEMKAGSWIWCIDQVVAVFEDECVLVLNVYDGRWCAYLELVSDAVPVGARVLSFPMTQAELAARDAEAAVKAV